MEERRRLTLEMLLSDHRHQQTVADADHFPGNPGGASLDVDHLVRRIVRSTVEKASNAHSIWN